MLCIQTQKGGYLVLVNIVYGCYTDAEGNFIRSVDDIEDEVAWAKQKWQDPKEIDFPHKELLSKQLPYIQEYKNSLSLVGD